MISKEYTEAEQDFVEEWTDRWGQFMKFIIYLVTHSEWPPFSPPPTDLDEIEYQSLRSWFIDQEPQFISLWKDYYQSQDWTLDPDDEELADMSESSNPYRTEKIRRLMQECDIESAEYTETYRPENLYRLMQDLDIQNGLEVWEPNQQRAYAVTLELVPLSLRLIEFRDWIYDRTPEERVEIRTHEAKK